MSGLYVLKTLKISFYCIPTSVVPEKKFVCSHYFVNHLAAFEMFFLILIV